MYSVGKSPAQLFKVSLFCDQLYNVGLETRWVKAWGNSKRVASSNQKTRKRGTQMIFTPI